MVNRSGQTQKQCGALITAVLRFGAATALSQIFLLAACPLSGAVEQSQKPAAPAALAKEGAKATASALDVELDRMQAAIDQNSLSEADLQSLADLVAKNPTAGRPHLLFGRALSQQGLPDQAREQFDLAVKYGPTDPMAIVEIIHDLINRGNMEAATAMLDNAIKRFPHNPDLLFLIGNFLKEKHHNMQASRAYSEAFKAGDPNHPVKGLPSAIGDLIVREEPDRAVLFAKLELKNYPDFLPAHLIIAKARFYKGNFEQAAAPLEKIYAQSPSNQETTQMYLRALFWRGEYHEALEPAYYNLRNVIHENMPETAASTMLSTVMAKLPVSICETTLQKFYSRAEKEGHPVDPPFHFCVGKVFFTLNRYAAAKAELLKFLDVSQASAPTLWMLGHIAENSEHDSKAALNYYRLAHAQMPLNSAIAADCRNMEERVEPGSNDWAWDLRNWLYSTFSFGQH